MINQRMERGSLFSDPFFGLEAFHWLEVPEGHKSRFLVKFVTKENEFQSQVYHNLVGGIPTPPKNMKVSWDDDIPNIWKKLKNNPNVPNHQPDNESCSPRLFFLFFLPDSAWRSFWRVRDFPVGSFSMAGREFVRHFLCSY